MSAKEHYEKNAKKNVPHYDRGPGRVLIVSQDHDREGNGVDVKNIEDTFKSLHNGKSKVTNNRNLTYEGMETMLMALKEEPADEKMKFLIIFVMAHGGNYNYAVHDSRGRVHKVDDISYILDRENAQVPLQLFKNFITEEYPPHFKGKPRLLIIHSCRGKSSNEMKGELPKFFLKRIANEEADEQTCEDLPTDVKTENVGNDDDATEEDGACLSGSKKTKDQQKNLPPNPTDPERKKSATEIFNLITSGSRHHPKYGDYAIMYSTLPDQVSYRQPKEGTWFIQDFCTSLTQHADEDIELILERTAKKMASRLVRVKGDAAEVQIGVREMAFHKKFIPAMKTTSNIF